ncbi:hypothetical protein B0H67DRAFT_642085 [Lasiosphaeris hirsuta]|uniref:Uncharacterized protein n=1 Tax=Lasiosphaeris hirsuta TaxID=260670 RepID=A0AA40B176_9PEZI|nr:hypothetical protein B0H67DRAFT_642085 [Lasiosphaeris hirsuta]
MIHSHTTCKGFETEVEKGKIEAERDIRVAKIQSGTQIIVTEINARARVPRTRSYAMPSGAKIPKRNELLLKEKKKMGLSGKDLCGNVLPSEFTTYIDYTRSLGFNDKPDCSYLRELF